MTRWLDEDEQRAWRALMTMSNRLNARLNRELQASDGLSQADYDVLVRLTDVPAGRLRVGDLADDLQWEQSRLSHQLTRMQRRGLIGRTGSPDDRRVTWVTLTEAGRAAIERAAPAHVEVVRRLVLDGLTRDQLTALGEIAQLVLTRLEN
jgi:DNA-binding MarR family transcriptional regulator